MYLNFTLIRLKLNCILPIQMKVSTVSKISQPRVPNCGEKTSYLKTYEGIKELADLGWKRGFSVSEASQLFGAHRRIWCRARPCPGCQVVCMLGNTLMFCLGIPLLCTLPFSIATLTRFFPSFWL